MAKRKHRKTACDTHHLLWTRRSWSKYKVLKTLRNHWYMRVEIPTSTLHHLIHHLLPEGVPLPRVDEAREALERLNELEKTNQISDDDNIIKRLETILPLFHGQTCNALWWQYLIANDFYQHHYH